MAVIFLSNYDWANVGWTLAEGLRRNGIPAKNYAFNPHPFGYRTENDPLPATEDELYNEIENSEFTVFMHSQLPELACGYPVVPKYAVYHGGTAYRTQHKRLNDFFNDVTDITLTQTADLLNLGAKNEHWFLPGIDVLDIPHDFSPRKPGRLVVGHFPSNAMKGTEYINEVIFDLHGLVDYKHSIERVSHQESLQRMSECDVYIEQLELGEWGITALEAAALGCVVITNFKSLDRYQREYDKNCGLLVANNQEELKQHLISLSQLNDISQLKQQSWAWALRNHSLEAVGRRLKELLHL